MSNSYKIYEGVKLHTLKHIPEISWYNSNHFIGLKREDNVCNDLLYASSDDDDIIIIYDMSCGECKKIGECYADEDYAIHVYYDI